MKKRITSIYLDDDLKVKLKKEALLKSINKPKERISVSSVITDIVVEYFNKKG